MDALPNIRDCGVGFEIPSLNFDNLLNSSDGGSMPIHVGL